MLAEFQGEHAAGAAGEKGQIFVGADTRQQDFGRETIFQVRRECFQEIVADLMSMNIIDEMKIIDIHSQAGAVRSLARIGQCGECFHESSAVQQAGQFVVGCLISPLLFPALQVGNVRQGADESNGETVAVTDHFAASLNPEPVAVLVAKPVFRFISGNYALQEIPPIIAAQVVGMNEFDKSFPLDRLRIIFQP